MKILSLIQSVLLSRKRNCIMISLCFIFTTLLFNLMIAISSDYINGVNYISKNRYDRTAIVTHTTSLKPLSAQRISDELKRQGIKCRMEILNINNSLMYSEQSRISDEYIKLLTYNLHPDNLSLYNRYEKDSFNVSGYTTELSEYLDVELEGEKPDINKDYGGKIPVIVQSVSDKEIGDTVKGRAAQGKFELLVVGKYKSNEVWDLLLSPGDLLYNSSYFTDYRILEKSGCYTPDNRDFTEKQYENDDNYFHQHFCDVILLKTDDMFYAELESRIRNTWSANDKQKGDIIFSNPLFGVDKDTFSRDYISLLQLFPAFIAIAVVGSIGIVANGFLNAESRIKAAAVFRSCGANTSKIAIINTVCELVVMLFSTIVSFIILLIIKLIFGLNIINADSILFTALYLLILTVLISIIGNITLLKSKMLDVIRRYENQ